MWTNLPKGKEKSMVKDRRSTDHNTQSNTHIIKFRGSAYLSGEQCLDYVISNEQWMTGEYGDTPEERIIKRAKFQKRQRSDCGCPIKDARD